jgi:integrase
VGAGIVKHFPLDSVRYLPEGRQVKTLPTKEEIERILRWFGANEPIFYPWIYFEMTRGWRRDELRLMKVQDVDLSAEILYVKNTKTRVERRERLQEQDCLILNEHLIYLKKSGLYQKHHKPLVPALCGYQYPGFYGQYRGCQSHHRTQGHQNHP